MHTGIVRRQDKLKARQQTDRPTQHTEAAAHFAFSLILHVRQHIKHVEQGSASESVERWDARESHVRKAGKHERHNKRLESNRCNKKKGNASACAAHSSTASVPEV